LRIGEQDVSQEKKAMASVAAAVVIQRNARGRENHANQDWTTQEEVVDDRPKYLRKFPSASSILKDLKLGVLLGRYGMELNMAMIPHPDK
jgi:hypothetical protein